MFGEEAETPLECLELCALDYADCVGGAQHFIMGSEEGEEEDEAVASSINDPIFERPPPKEKTRSEGATRETWNIIPLTNG